MWFFFCYKTRKSDDCCSISLIWVLVCCQKVRQERCFLAVGILGLVVLNVNFNLGVDGSIYWILTNRVLLRELDICVSCSEILFGDSYSCLE